MIPSIHPLSLTPSTLFRVSRCCSHIRIDHGYKKEKNFFFHQSLKPPSMLWEWIDRLLRKVTADVDSAAPGASSKMSGLRENPDVDVSSPFESTVSIGSPAVRSCSAQSLTKGHPVRRQFLHLPTLSHSFLITRNLHKI